MIYHAISMRFWALLSLLLIGACATTAPPPGKPVPEAWRTVPEAPGVTNLCSLVPCAETTKSSVHVAAGRLYNGARGLTPELGTIRGFDVSADRGEVVFSAPHGGNYDIGLVALEGSEIQWIPSDRFDETDPQWAPRGNKVSYVVHTPRGDVVRTVHIPTAVQLSVDFAGAQVDALAWEPAAERYAVVLESPDKSPWVESVKYGGEERRTALAPAEHLDVAIEPIAGALVLRPAAIRYGEKLPLVVWIDEHPLRWSDARAALLRNARVAVAIVPKPPEDAFWSEAGKTKWIDGQRTYMVGGQGKGKAIVEDAGVPAGFYRDEGSVIRVGKVQSFAAGYIAHELSTNDFR